VQRDAPLPFGLADVVVDEGLEVRVRVVDGGFGAVVFVPDVDAGLDDVGAGGGAGGSGFVGEPDVPVDPLCVDDAEGAVGEEVAALLVLGVATIALATMGGLIAVRVNW
jgi:hypothetical protein